MNLETKITIYKFTPQVFTLTRLHLGLHQSRQIAVYTKKKAAIFLDNCLIFK